MMYAKKGGKGYESAMMCRQNYFKKAQGGNSEIEE